MIRVICDNCSKPIDVGDDMAGQKVKCPACGDVNVIPATGKAPAPRTDRAAEAGYPAADAPEVRVMLVRRAMLRAKPLTFLLLLVGVLAGAGGAIYGLLVLSPGNPVVGIGSAVVGLIALVTLLAWRVAASGEVLEITNKRTMGRTGILSKSTSDVMHKDVRNIQVRQTFRQRLLNIGELCVSSAAEDDHEILVQDIPRPNRVREIIDLYRT